MYVCKVYTWTLIMCSHVCMHTQPCTLSFYLVFRNVGGARIFALNDSRRQ